MTRRRLWISLAALALFAFLFSQDALARVAWQKYRSPAAALALDRGDAGLAMQIGNYYFGGGAYNLSVAERAYRKAVAVNPKILWGHYQLARILFVKGDYGGALAEINLELEANPENLRSLYVRGLVYGYRGLIGDFLLAEADFYRFTQWAPKEWAGYNDLAWVQSKQAKYREARDTIQAALAVVPDGRKNPWLWNAKGVAELNLNEYREARKSFAEAAALAASLTDAEWRRAYPGNAPSGAAAGLAAFREAITENLKRAESHLGK